MRICAHHEKHPDIYVGSSARTRTAPGSRRRSSPRRRPATRRSSRRCSRPRPGRSSATSRSGGRGAGVFQKLWTEPGVPGNLPSWSNRQYIAWYPQRVVLFCFCSSRTRDGSRLRCVSWSTLGVERSLPMYAALARSVEFAVRSRMVQQSMRSHGPCAGSTREPGGDFMESRQQGACKHESLAGR